MKSKRLLLLAIPLILLLAFSRPAYSQDEDAPKPIRVTETLHNDGTRTVMRSDPENHSSESETYNQANKLLEKTVYTLDDQGQATGATVYSPKGKALYKLAYKRDASNQVTEVDTYTLADVLVSRTLYRYASGGRVVGINTYDASGNQISSSTAPPAGANGGDSTPSKKRPYNPNR